MDKMVITVVPGLPPNCRVAIFQEPATKTYADGRLGVCLDC